MRVYIMFTKKIMAVACASVGFSGAALALEPAPIKVGEAKFIPTLDVNVTTDSNIRASNAFKQSATIANIAPKLLLEADTRNSAYQLEYKANHRQYNGDYSDSLTDHGLAARGILDFDIRNRLKLEATHDRRESIENPASLTQLASRVGSTGLGADYFFGAPDAMFNAEFGAKMNLIRSTDNEVATKGIDRDFKQLNASLLYRVSPKTQLELEGRLGETSYIESASKVKDSTQHAVLAGVRWEATAQTTGRAKAGYEQRKTDLRTTERPSWEVAIDWAPLTYSTFTLSSQQATQDGTLASQLNPITNTNNQTGFTAIQSARHSVNWTHGWSDRFKSTVSYARVEEQFVQDLNGASDRTDTFNQTSLVLTYALRRWVDLKAGYTYSDRDSNTALRTFDRHQVLLGVSMSL